MGKRVAVIGASGFVGATLVEDSLKDGTIELVPVIHSSGNAWRLIRHGLSIRTADLLNRESVASALDGCTHVVNCSRGDNDVMLTGLRNMLAVAAEKKIQGFVHLSSVMVYGDPPSPDSTSENGATPRQPKSSYAGVKFVQDRMVKRAAAAGLPSLILCPPNISGPYSYFLGGVLGAVRDGAFGLLEGGNSVCNLVDVGNLAHAIMLALDHCSRASPRMFVTDDEALTWRHVIDGLAPLCEDAPPAPRLERAELMKMRDDFYTRPRVRLVSSIKHLVSSDVRAALRKDPLWGRVDAALRQGVARLGGFAEDKLRLAVEGPIRVAKASSGRPLNVTLSIQQLRGIRHSCALAKDAIGYTPRYSFTQSMAAYCSWYRSHIGRDSQYWQLARFLCG